MYAVLLFVYNPFNLLEINPNQNLVSLVYIIFIYSYLTSMYDNGLLLLMMMMMMIIVHTHTDTHTHTHMYNANK